MMSAPNDAANGLLAADSPRSSSVLSIAAGERRLSPAVRAVSLRRSKKAASWTALASSPCRHSVTAVFFFFFKSIT